MKSNFNKAVSRRAARLQQKGVALVITLLMLSIITFMAVTFLVLSQRERSSVTTTTDMKIARNASDTALARVSAELLTRMLVNSNFQDFDLMVSTNYINYAGFVDAIPPTPTNVNYDYEANNGGPMTNAGSAAWNRNIGDLLYNPRVPVFVVTNRGTGAGEFRYYLDLNRNGRFDRNGNWPYVVTDNAGNPEYITTNAAGEYVSVATNYTGWVVSNSFVGDPEWIGVLEHPDELHSPDNRFIARYAYIVVPVGKTLDINYIHNRAKRLGNTTEGFLRNQGVGTWEINLAGFLADLNTNAWWNLNNYLYNTNPLGSSLGSAFVDANNILSYRYGNTPNGYRDLSPANALLGASAGIPGVDLYSDGPLMLGTINNASAIPDVPAISWSGADNPNHFFSQQDLFDVAKITPPSFQQTLSYLGTSNDTYNAYTFYRMLAQMGTDSSPERNKLNINFKNTDIHGNVVPGMETNLISWTPVGFFTNAANRMLAQITNQIGYPLSTADIPLYPTNYYTPAVHRILQLAANIYDATTNQTVPLIGNQTNDFFPSVFRPTFTSQGGHVWISGYQEVTDTTPLQYQYWDMAYASNHPSASLAGINIYGVPWVIGAKKGFPNFNEYAIETAVSVSRKLKLFKSVAGGRVTDVKQLFDVGISNNFAVEAWNSYTNTYPRTLMLSVSNEVGMGITDQSGINLIPPGWATYVQTMPLATNIPANTWNRFVNQSQPNGSILVPLQGGYVFLTNATYVPTIPSFVPNNPADFISEGSNAMPEFYLTTTNRVQYSVVDRSANRVVDFVNLENVSTVDISQFIRNATTCGAPGTDKYVYWCTNPISPPSTPFTPGIPLNQGVNYQIGVAAGIPQLSKTEWQQIDPDDPQNQGQINKFQHFLFPGDGDTNLVMQTPFNPTAYAYQNTSWQANDPLVHYTIGDLTDPAKISLEREAHSPPLDNIGQINTRYRPWGGNQHNSDNGPNGSDYNIALKDPGVTESSAWDFPTNKFPGLGWLGRIHRGTPWQTVYMKSPLVASNSWQTWSGDLTYLTNGNVAIQDLPFSFPTNDYKLFDIFTAAVNDNATRGQLDINQTNLAAWSAILSGVNVITNSSFGALGPAAISPAGVYDPVNPAAWVAQIWKGINDTRANTNFATGMVFPNHTFQHLGDVLATPQLSAAAPFLNTNTTAGASGTGLSSMGANGINDEIMERIPQQIMSLLTLNQTPRFVIYSFGQTLHPADHSLVIGGTFNGLCTNYQITAESATRAVVRVEGTPDPQYVNGKVDSLGRSYPPHIVVEQFNVLGPD